MSATAAARRWLPAVALLVLCAAPAPAQITDPQFQPALARRDLTAQPLLDLALAGERLVAVGDSGLIITSDDNGGSWVQAAVPVSATLTAVDFPTPQRGWAVGHAGVILRSDDAGSSWVLQFDGRDANRAWLQYTAERRARLEARLEALEAGGETDADLVYAVEDAIFDEEDAQLALETGPADPFLDVCFLDAERGFAAGAYGMFYATADGGDSWRLQVAGIDNPGRFHFYAIHAAASGPLYLAGEQGLLYRSDDGGARFRRYPAVYDGSLFGLLPLGDAVLAYGLRGNLFLQGAGRDDWERVAADNARSLYGGGVLDEREVLLLGAGGAALRVTAQRRITPLQHPSRSTFSSALRAPDGKVWLAGVEGLARLSEAREE